MKRKATAVLIMVGAITLAVWQLAPADETTETVSAPGYRVNVDPDTGILTDVEQPMDPADFPKSLQDALSTSSEGLEERRSPVSGGGYMVDLQGRFQNTAVATVDTEGDLSAPCVEGIVQDHEASTTNTGDKE